MTIVAVHICKRHGLTEHYMRSPTKKGDCKKCLKERVARQRAGGDRDRYEKPEIRARREMRRQAKETHAGIVASVAPLSVAVDRGCGRVNSFDPTTPTGGCLWIAGDDFAEKIGAGIDPHCGKPRAARSVYCEKHTAIAYVPSKQAAIA